MKFIIIIVHAVIILSIRTEVVQVVGDPVVVVPMAEAVFSTMDHASMVDGDDANHRNLGEVVLDPAIPVVGVPCLAILDSIVHQVPVDSLDSIRFVEVVVAVETVATCSFDLLEAPM